MTNAGRPTAGGPVAGFRRRESHTERRERRAAVDDPEVVLAAAARYLESRSRSVAETRRHLVAGGYRAELVEGAIERLVGLGILDDATFARAWVESRDRAHPRGERALRSELLRLGIERELIEIVLEERAGQDAGGEHGPEEHGPGGRNPDERAAVALLERHRASLERVADPRVRQGRAYALLARNGFDPETAALVAERFVRGSEAG